MKKLFILFAVFAMACNAQKSENNAGAEKDSTEALTDTTKTGADKDEHGCIGSAGYTWSVLKNDCVRVFEQTKLMPTETGGASASAAYFLFNADETKAELFLPETKEGAILERTGNEGSYIWKKDDLELSKTSGYTLQKAGKVIYQSK